MSDGFDTFLGWLTPSEAERNATSKHRTSVENCIRSNFGLNRFFQTGSFNHGTAVSVYSDVDYFADPGGVQPGSSDTALNSFRSALQAYFPTTTVRVSRPAVVVEFANGSEGYEVVPAYHQRGTGSGRVYDIPGPSAGWIESAPDTHLSYVNGRISGTKSLARLLKAWKYYRDVPISSFYLEMRAARYAAGEHSILYSWDVLGVLRELQGHELAEMNDPSGVTGRFSACSSAALKTEALSKLNTAVARADNAQEAESNNQIEKAFSWWDKLFAGRFPAYY